MKLSPYYDNGRILGGTAKDDNGTDIASFSIQVHRKLKPEEATAIAAAVRGFLNRADPEPPNEVA